MIEYKRWLSPVLIRHNNILLSCFSCDTALIMICMKIHKQKSQSVIHLQPSYSVVQTWANMLTDTTHKVKVSKHHMFPYILPPKSQNFLEFLKCSRAIVFKFLWLLFHKFSVHYFYLTIFMKHSSTKQNLTQGMKRNQFLHFFSNLLLVVCHKTSFVPVSCVESIKNAKDNTDTLEHFCSNKWFPEIY